MPPLPPAMAWRPGDLQAAFGRASRLEQYGPRVLRQPARKIPWIVQFDRFFSEGEVREALELLGRVHWQAAALGDGARVALRNSSHAWLSIPAAAQKGAGVRVLEVLMRKMEHLVGIGRAHFESVQAVRYERGQYYRRHHDTARTVPLDRNESKWHFASPMRILTAFLYLTDVAAGGETRFTLGPGGQAETVAVQPAAGRLVLFPNVLDAEPHVADYRTRHEAATVAGGLKLGLNVWVHLCPPYSPAAAGAWACQLHGGKWHDDQYAKEQGHAGAPSAGVGRAYEHALRDAASEHTGTLQHAHGRVAKPASSQRDGTPPTRRGRARGRRKGGRTRPVHFDEL